MYVCVCAVCWISEVRCSAFHIVTHGSCVLLTETRGEVRYIRPESTSSANTHSWLFYSHSSLGLFLAVCSTFACFFLSSLKHSAAYSKMLSVFVLCHLFCSNIITLRSWWCETTNTDTWISATSCPQSLLFSSQQLVFCVFFLRVTEKY